MGNIRGFGVGGAVVLACDVGLWSVSVAGNDATTSKVPDGSLDDAAFAQVIEEQRALLYHFFARRVAPPIAEDLCSETLVQVWATRDRFDREKGTVGAWMQGYAHRILLRFWRDVARGYRAARRVSARDEPMRIDPDIAADVIERLDLADRSVPIGELLGVLTPAQREVVELHLVREIPCSVLADLSGVSAGAMRARLRRARVKLQAEVLRRQRKRR